MSGYTRVIRGIERTADYTSVKPASRYAAYKLTAYEQVAGVLRHEGVHTYNQAADSAASWLGIARSAQNRLESMIQALGRDRGIEQMSILSESIGQLVQSINDWETGYRRYKEMLKPEIWEAVELALRHPAMEELGIKRDVDGRFHWDGGESQMNSDSASIGMPYDLSQLRRLLLGAEGLLMDLKRAMSYAEQQRPVDLLRLSFAAAYPYALYYGASQAYWPLPPRGAIVNKYV